MIQTRFCKTLYQRIWKQLQLLKRTQKTIFNPKEHSFRQFKTRHSYKRRIKLLAEVSLCLSKSSKKQRLIHLSSNLDKKKERLFHKTEILVSENFISMGKIQKFNIKSSPKMQTCLLNLELKDKNVIKFQIVLLLRTPAERRKKLTWKIILILSRQIMQGMNSRLLKVAFLKENATKI